MSKFLVRIRHSKGTTRIELPTKSSTTIKQLKELISQQLSNKPLVSTQQLTMNGKQSDIPLKNNLTLSILNITHGHMFYLKIVSSAIICQSNNNNKNKNKNKNKPSRKRKANQINTSCNAPPKKRTRLNNNNNKKVNKKVKKKKNKNEFLIIKSEGNTIEEIVNNYFSVTNELEIALKLLPIDIAKLYLSTGRIESIFNEKVEITEYLEQSRFTSKAKSRGKRHLIIIYSYKRKKRKEIVCFYDDDKIKEIIKNILWKSIDKNDREKTFIKNKINNENIIQLIKKSKLTLNEIANRSPPLVWSIFHSFPNQQIDKVIVQFVTNSWKELRVKIKQEMQQNNHNK